MTAERCGYHGLDLVDGCWAMTLPGVLTGWSHQANPNSIPPLPWHQAMSAAHKRWLLRGLPTQICIDGVKMPVNVMMGGYETTLLKSISSRFT